MRAMKIGQCQACGGDIDGPPTYPVPGVVIARLCVVCRQDYQRLIMGSYPEFVADFDETMAKLHRAGSGLPSSTGLSSGSELYTHRIDLEQTAIKIWDEFIEAKQAEQKEEEGND